MKDLFCAVVSLLVVGTVNAQVRIFLDPVGVGRGRQARQEGVVGVAPQGDLGPVGLDHCRGARNLETGTRYEGLDGGRAVGPGDRTGVLNGYGPARNVANLSHPWVVTLGTDRTEADVEDG